MTSTAPRNPVSESAAANPEIGHRVEAAGVSTNYHDEGSGAPVLLIHGSGPGVSAWANWRLVLPELARSRRVIAPDIVGFGYTERPPDFPYTREAWVAHLVGFLDALELDRVSIVGNSFGGAMALWLAVEHPERVDCLTLMGSVGTSFPITPGLEAVWGYEPSVENMAELLELFSYDRSRLGADLARLRFEASIRPGVQESYSAMFPPPRQDGVEALALSEELTRSISHDTLIVHGREDQVIPLQSSLTLFSLIPRSQLHVFGQCGHWTQIERTAEFVALLDQFLPKHEATAPSLVHQNGRTALNTPVSTASSTVQQIADALDRAARTGTPIAPPSAGTPGLDLDTAYAVQQVNIQRAVDGGDLRVGHKIGLTSRAMQQQLGVDSPDFGVLLSSMDVPDGSTVTLPLLQPRIEAEIAFRLGQDLLDPNLSVDDVLAATAAVMPALEIIDSRVADWKITLLDTVADNASSGAFVLGDEVPLPTDLREVELVLTCDGVEVGRGSGSAALGHPAECVRWLASTLAELGDPLRAGSVILSGAVHASVPASPGAVFTARSDALGSVSVTFPGKQGADG